MRDFSQLLDALVYTRSRNAKLKLIGDYLRETPDPDRGYGARGADRQARPARGEARRDPRDRRGAGRSGAALHEPRLCRRHGRDGVAALAECATGQPPKSTTARFGISDVVERLAPGSRPRRRARSPRCSTISTRRGRFALLKLATGALRIGISARLAKVALAEAFGLDVDAVEEVWHGIGPPYLPTFDWAEGRGAQPTAETCPSSARSCSPIRSRRRGSRSTIMPPNGNGTASASSSSMPAARPGSTAAPATTLPRSFPDVAEAFARDRRARRRTAGRGRVPGRADGMAAPRRASTRSSSGSAARTSQPKMLGDYPAFVRLYDILFDGDEDLRELPLARASRAARSLRRAARPRPVRPFGADRGRRASRRWRRSAPAPATPRSRA